MLEAIVKHGIIFYVMGIMMVIGIIAKVVSHLTVRKMVAAASEIQKSNHKLMRLIKAKFEHASMVSDKVQNVKVFVKKYMYEFKTLGLRLNTWRGVQQKTRWFLLLFGGIGILGSYQVNGMGEEVIQYIGWTGILFISLFVIQSMSDENAKLEAAENYIVDYLENVCTRRYEKVSQAIAYAEEQPEIIPEEMNAKEESDAQKQRADQELRIRAILEEFLA